MASSPAKGLPCPTATTILQDTLEPPRDLGWIARTIAGEDTRAGPHWPTA